MMGISAGPDMVQNGLVLLVDATNPISYPGSGAVWYDVSGNNNNRTFSSTPSMTGGTFNTLGSVYAYRNYIPVNSATNGYTMEVGFKIKSSLTNTWQNILQNGPAGPNRHMIWYNGGSNTFLAMFHIPNNYNNISQQLVFDKWYYLQMSYNPGGWGANGRRAWLNGIEQNVNDTAAGNADITSSYFTVGVESDLSSLKSNSSYSFIRYYNRFLTEQEIKQNYNALKSRFNL
jgi:hypothetical protein